MHHTFVIVKSTRLHQIMTFLYCWHRSSRFFVSPLFDDFHLVFIHERVMSSQFLKSPSSSTETSHRTTNWTSEKEIPSKRFMPLTALANLRDSNFLDHIYDDQLENEKKAFTLVSTRKCRILWTFLPGAFGRLGDNGAINKNKFNIKPIVSDSDGRANGGVTH